VNETVNLSFRYSESDYARALRAHYTSRLQLRLDIVAAIVLLVLGVYLWHSPDLDWLGKACVAVSAVFVLILIAAFIVIPPLAFRREPKFRDDYSLTFSQDGIHFATAHVDSHLQWSLYSRALVDAHSYVLYYGSRQFTVIPKRVFQSAEQQQTFEQLLAQHVPKIVTRDT
jgi:YcxB-like protein